MNVPLLIQERRQLLAFARILAGYGCAGDGVGLCGQCSPCEAQQWLSERGLVEPTGRRPLNARESEVLREMPNGDGWQRPMDVGGSDGNDVSRVLMSLVRKGHVEMKHWAGHCRPSYRYRRLGSVVAEARP